VVSGGITGTPASLPVNWSLVNGYLVGPTADLLLAKLSGADLSGADIAGADMAEAILSNANLSGTDLASANLTYADASGADLDGADVAGGNLYGANLTSAKLVAANLSGVDLTDAALSGANLTRTDLKGATVAGANFANVIWQDTTCPNGLNSNLYIDGCFSQRLYGLAGFMAPKPGSTVSGSARQIVVRFRFTNAAGHLLGSGTAAALAAQHRVKAVLTGSGANVGALCGWDKTTAYFSCVIKIPSKVKTGRKHRYTITAMENLGRVFSAAPADPGAVNPEVIYFR
jgi:uncharacterized protein YjbI with pentapeptide repeats